MKVENNNWQTGQQAEEWPAPIFLPPFFFAFSRSRLALAQRAFGAVFYAFLCGKNSNPWRIPRHPQRPKKPTKSG